MGLLKSGKSIEELLKDKEVEYGIKAYCLIQDELNNNINLVDNVAFRSTFQTFYRLEERKPFLKFDNKNQFFEVFELLKNDKNVDFEICIREISHISNNCEKVFASKVLHTINPNYPIMDSIVASYFGINTGYTYGGLERNIVKNIKIYDKFCADYHCYLRNDPEAQEIIDTYQRLYPNYMISEVKIIDFVLWADGKVIKQSN